MTVISERSFPWEGSWPYLDPQAFCYTFSHVHLRGGLTEQLRWASGICQSAHYRPFPGTEVMQEPLSLLLVSVICWNRWATSKPPIKNDHFPILIPDPWLGIDWEGMISRPQHFLYVFGFLTHFDGEWSVSSVFATERCTWILYINKENIPKLSSSAFYPHNSASSFYLQFSYGLMRYILFHGANPYLFALVKIYKNMLKLSLHF